MMPDTVDAGYGFTVTTRGAAGTARATFMCPTKKCRTDEGAPTYELPIAATRCPVCGSKRLTRIWTPPNINTGHAKKVDAIVEAPVTAALAQRDAQRLARQRYPMVRAVPMRNLGATLHEVYAQTGAPPGWVNINQADLRRKATLGGTIPGMAGQLAGVPMPRQIAAVDREFRLVRGTDGGPEIAKA